jgi:hypothetical protein
MKGEWEMSINLAEFCNPERCEPGCDLSVPFSLNLHTYAINGEIAVRVPRHPDIPENKEAPNAKAEGLPWDFSRVKFGPLPEPEPLSDRCMACGGQGRKHYTCPDCHCECEFCAGSGKTPPRVWVGKAIFASRYIEQMQTLPGLEIGKPKPPPHPLPFRFKGGEGLLMPMTY